MRKTMILAAVLTVMGAASALAQGIVVNKTDGTKVYFNASEVVSVTTFGYGEDGPHAPANAVAVDLGLPSGTKWANMNVGAEKPEDYGDYFAWGETKPKDVYIWETYIHWAGSAETCHDIGSDIAGEIDYDAATANWGSPWKMPTYEQCKELIDNCTSEWTQENGIYGRKFTGPSGGTIFLPAAGTCGASGLGYAGSNGLYWASTLHEFISGSAYYLGIRSETAYQQSEGQRLGVTVRPVR